MHVTDQAKPHRPSQASLGKWERQEMGVDEHPSSCSPQQWVQCLQHHHHTAPSAGRQQDEAGQPSAVPMCPADSLSQPRW